MTMPSAYRRPAMNPVMGAVAMCTVIVGTVVIGIRLGYHDIDVWGAFLVPTVLCLGTIPFIRVVERRHGTGLANLVTTALVAKMVGAYARYLVMNHVYTGNDSGRYHQAGKTIAEEYFRGDRTFFSLFPRDVGTKYIEELNGLVAVVSSRSMMASYMVFSWFGFLGLWACVGAFRRALPEGNLKRYALLTFFLPSALFWPSSLGKEAWILLGIGLFAVGTSRIFTSQARGLVYVVLGTLASGVVRPHVAAILLFALLIAVIVRRGHTTLGPILTMATVLLIAAGAAFASGLIEDILPSGDQGLTAVLEVTQERTSTGGSEIDVTAPNSPVEYPAAFFTVLFRPLPFEVRTATQLISALETTVLLVLFFALRRDVGRALRRILTVPYLRFAGVYTAAFAFAWSSIGNLGIIARQRVLVLPFLVVFLCLSAPRVVPAPRELSSMAARHE